MSKLCSYLEHDNPAVRQATEEAYMAGLQDYTCEDIAVERYRSFRSSLYFFHKTLVRPALDLQGFLLFIVHPNAKSGHDDMKYS